MKHRLIRPVAASLWVLCLGALAAVPARADVITDWNARSCDILAEANLGTPPANRVMAIVQTAAFEAANAVTRRYPVQGMPLTPPWTTPGASLAAAVAAAHHVTLLKLLPAQQASIEASYLAALAVVDSSKAKDDGIAVGEHAAAAVLARRLDDGAATPESYRPATTPGVYVPTVIPLVSQWPLRKPWLLASAAQLRPGPPPTLTSELWARDFNESRALGAKRSAARTAEQTEQARFWEVTSPQIYHGLLRSAAAAPGRDVMQNARLFMRATQAADDAIIAVFDAKYAYGFWRPITAIRNGDQDANNATEREAAWVPFIDTPMHPEYPCAHCIVAAAIGEVLRAEFRGMALPPLSTTSPTAPGITHHWKSVDDFVQEVSNARIYDGVHFRNSTEVGVAMGRQIGEMAVATN